MSCIPTRPHANFLVNFIQNSYTQTYGARKTRMPKSTLKTGKTSCNYEVRIFYNFYILHSRSHFQRHRLISHGSSLLAPTRARGNFRGMQSCDNKNYKINMNINKTKAKLL